MPIMHRTSFVDKYLVFTISIKGQLQRIKCIIHIQELANELHTKTSSSFSYSCRQNTLFSDSLSDAEGDRSKVTVFPVTTTSSVNTILYNDDCRPPSNLQA